ncbi:glycosyl hydrolase family 18 protein, partial [Streptomyces parvulus]|uniref:glycosyl hydrolase family 18 protein n=1 Tax=Streptomyces parvulus TaxID=146923 RepID=UPI0033DB6A2E
NDSASAANFANSVYSVMQEYGFDGVDIDLENVASTRARRVRCAPPPQRSFRLRLQSLWAR